MTSTIAWLDASREDQRRMREIVNLFSQAESRDELGVGQIRDAFSDLLFPGTSTLHTRARYLLFIPWCYQAAVPRASDPKDLERRAAVNERRLIVALHKADQTDGLIGKQVLDKLKTLPSSLYWSALKQYGILEGELADALAAKKWMSEADELVDRRRRMWNAPAVPAGFPETADRLDLSADEASWVKERILSGSRDTLFEVLLKSDHTDCFEAPGPWAVPVSSSDLRELLHHARLFSACINAAAFTYNLAVGRRYEAKGLGADEAIVEHYVGEIDSWMTTNDHLLAELPAWDLPDLWTRVHLQNPNIGPITRTFVENWIDLLASGGRPDSPAAVTMVTTQEKRRKGPQSRLVNDRLLATWSGRSGTKPFDYRWGNIAQIITDIQDGLQRAAS